MKEKASSSESIQAGSSHLVSLQMHSATRSQDREFKTQRLPALDPDKPVDRYHLYRYICVHMHTERERDREREREGLEYGKSKVDLAFGSSRGSGSLLASLGLPLPLPSWDGRQGKRRAAVKSWAMARLHLVMLHVSPNARRATVIRTPKKGTRNSRKQPDQC